MRKKVYGSSKLDICPFCSKQATTSNKEKVPVCRDHKEEKLPDLKCACGEWLDQKSSKYGVFFTCMSCGPVSWKKAMESNTINSVELPYKTQSKSKPSTSGQKDIPSNAERAKRKEVVLTAEEADLYYC